MLSKIEDLLREVGRSIIMPSYRKLAVVDVEEKSPGEIVTTIDRRAEQEIVARLNDVAPSIVAIGEEEVAANPRLLDDFYRGAFDRCWLIDPLDGTGNFVSGDDRFAVMVALIHKGTTVASWIYEPVTDRVAVSEIGGGAFLGGRKISVPERSPNARLCGSVLDRFLPRDEFQRIAANLPNIDRLPGSKCAGTDYPALAEGRQDFNLYWRLFPWDHAAGALFLSEAGGCVRYFDGSPYCVGRRTSGLIAATTVATWERTRDTLLK
jgi:fructose-1,6-bisphosphatase/inositol monophosphatase family enzyme